MKFFASCGKGLEYLLADEMVEPRLRARHRDHRRRERRGRAWRCAARGAGRGWPARILWPIAEFDCADEHALYAGAAEIDWTRHVGAGHSIVDAHVSVRPSPTRATPRSVVRTRWSTCCAMRPARGLMSMPKHRMRASTLNHPKGGRRCPSASAAARCISAAGAARRVRRRSGKPRRGAAARRLVAGELGRWRSGSRCGSGTRLLIEGALMAADVAPQPAALRRTPPTRWPGSMSRHGTRCWPRRERAQRGFAALRPCIHGSDIDPHAIRIALRERRAAGVENRHRFHRA